MFEKERSRATRKREAAEDRLLLRKDRVLGRSGLGRSGGAGLSVAGLEDDDGMPLARGTKSKGSAKRRKTNRRGDIYSDDEDEDMPRGRGREDEYDREDDFLAASDEEPEIYDDDAENEPEAEEEDDDPDVDDLEIEGRETVIENRTRGGNERDGRDGRRERERDRDRGSTPKRDRAAADDDAEAEADDEPAPQGSPQARKKRRVIDDDDDDE
jgi:RNA polymerase-associated protein LEO1